jgi:hypothetical protein
MEQLNRWADNVCMYTFYLPASFSAIGFQEGAGMQNPRFSQSCAPPISCTLSLSLSLSRPSISLLSLSRSTQDRCRAHRLCRGKGRADGRNAGWARAIVRCASWQHTEHTLPDDCHTATSWWIPTTRCVLLNAQLPDASWWICNTSWVLLELPTARFFDKVPPVPTTSA